MNNITSGIDRQHVRSLYEDATAKIIMDHFKTRERGSKVTKVKGLKHALAEHSVANGKIVRFFRKLESIGCGEFVVGRRGQPSRFLWAVNLVRLAQLAAGQDVRLEGAPTIEEKALNNGLIDHSFRLRKDLNVTLSLPDDLTPTEASRLSAFIHTLPFAALVA